MGRLIEAFAQFFDNDGDPLINGWLQFLESGSNNTLKNTYNDANLQIINANPLQLDGAGRCPSVFGQGDYRVVSYTQNIEDEADFGSMVQMFDPVTAAGTATGGSGGAGLVAWTTTDTYDLGDIVTYNNAVYRSLINGNVNLNPAVETSSWEKIEFLQVWNANVTYEIYDLVHYEGNVYVSLASSNLANQPDESTSYWRALGTGFYETEVKTANYEILPLERDYLFILGAATATDVQFDLPVVTSTDDLFRVGIYNASSYELTINALGGLNVGINASGDIVIAEGTYIEVTYVHSLTAWIVQGAKQGVLADDAQLIFGTGKDTSLYHNGTNFYVINSTGEFIIGNASNEDLIFYTNNTARWQISSTGHLLPQTPDVSDLGDMTQEVRHIFQAGVHYFGSTQQAYINHNETSFIINNDTGAFAINNEANAVLTFGTNNITRWGIDATGHFVPNIDDTYNIGSATFMIQYAFLANNPTLDNHAANKGYVDSLLGMYNNLLINPAFAVSQYGYPSGGTYNDGSYFLDRWRSSVNGSTISWSGDTLTISVGGGAEQVVEDINIPNGQYTISWLGTAEVSIDGGTSQTSPYTFTVSSGTHVTVGFGEGTVQHPVLVRGQEPGLWHPRLYSEEKAACERYLQIVPYMWSGMTTNGDSYYVEVTLRTVMRGGTPAVSFQGKVINGFGTADPVVNLLRYGSEVPADYCGIQFGKASNATVTDGYYYGYALVNCEL